MELFIQIRDGKPFEHPILGSNFREAFPHLDVNNLPPNFAKFERVDPPEYGVYETLRGPSYEWIDGIIKDVWYVRPMTEQEILEKQEHVKLDWTQRGYPSWIFDENTCSFVPPIPYPIDGKYYNWNESTLSWDEITE